MAQRQTAMRGTRTVTATEAQVHFGAMLRSVKEHGESVIVERAGEPEAVLISMDDFRELRRLRPIGESRSMGERFLALREEILAAMGDRSLGDVDDLINYGQR